MKKIYVGLTGLSRSGKTVFLTSVIYHLTETKGRGLKAIENSGWSYSGSRVEISDKVKEFPYKDNFRKFRLDPPKWPEPTVEPAEYHVRLRLTKGRQVHECEIVFVDYPGELLLDVALLEVRYDEMSNESWKRMVKMKLAHEIADQLKQKADALKSFAEAADPPKAAGATLDVTDRLAGLTSERLEELRASARAAGSMTELTNSLEDITSLAEAAGARAGAIDRLRELRTFAKEMTSPADLTSERLKSLAERARDAAEAVDRVTWLGEKVGLPAREFLAQVENLRTDAKGRATKNEKDLVQHAFDAYCDASRSAGIPVSPALSSLKPKGDDSRELGPYFPLDADARNRLPAIQDEMKKRYDGYRENMIRPSFNRIALCSHQVVLVDVLGALRSGPDKYAEIREQMRSVMVCYRKLNEGFYKSFLAFVGIRPKISKVSFCATKADQATSEYRKNLKNLLEILFELAIQDLVGGDTGAVKKPEFYCIAAHRCTTDIHTTHQGKPLVGLKGRLKGEEDDDDEGDFFPGRVPLLWPGYAKEWRNLHFPDFAPRSLPVPNGDPLPNIDMDQIIHGILKDEFGEN